jgi:hypothetical protein
VIRQEVFCQNLNHRRTTVTVRHCPQCGEVVNADVRKARCEPPDHAARVRDGASFCMHCGLRLTKR